MNGTRGSVIFEYARLNELRLGRSSDEEHLYGMRTIRAEHPTHPYAANWWAIGQGVGYGASSSTWSVSCLPHGQMGHGRPESTLPFPCSAYVTPWSARSSSTIG